VTDPVGVRVRKRRSRRRRRIRRLRWLALLMLLFASTTIGWLATNRPHSFSQAALVKSPSPAMNESLSLLATRAHLRPTLRRPGRSVYRYSVVPGGVRTPEELRAIAAYDRALADHYAGFRYDRAHLVRLQHAELVYLSYRMNGKIYWTRTRHPLPAGETLITDGEIAGRTRCANRISARKQLGVAPIEPPQEALEQLEPPAMVPPENVNFPAQYQSAMLTGSEPGQPWIGPQALDPWFLFPPPLPTGFGGGCRPVVKKGADKDFDVDKTKDGDSDDRCQPPPPGKPPSTVPEPSTWILLAWGVVALGLLLRMKRTAAV
jgi:hypothetical protein